MNRNRKSLSLSKQQETTDDLRSEQPLINTMTDQKTNALERLHVLNSQFKNKTNQKLSPSKSLDYYRSLGTTNPEQLFQTLFGTKHHIRTKIFNIICSNPDKFNASYMSEFDRQTSRQISFQELIFIQNNLNMSYEDYQRDPHVFSMISNSVAFWNPAVSVKFEVHFTLYGKSLMNLGTSKHQQFINRMMNYEDIGSFALTEMAHGSNVRGIQTTAEFDEKTNQFIINTPKKTDMKFWIGATAQLANMTICWAQLLIKGKCHGVHGFIVQIRNKTNHLPMPGVTIGDCGSKNGLDGVDNGFLIFNNVRIPYDNMLDKFSKIENNQFNTQIENETARFGMFMASLSGGRVQIALNSVMYSIIAITIAGRYSAIRQQFNKPSNTSMEQSIIEYKIMQYRVLPNLAATIIQQIATVELCRLWDENNTKQTELNKNILKELHPVSSIVKAICSWTSTRIITESRQILGGHGFHAFNRFGQLYNDNDVNTTWEGDNFILLQQTSKFLLGVAQKQMKGLKVPFKSTEFISLEPAEGQVSDLNEEKDFLDYSKLLKAFQWRTNLLLQQTSMKIQEYLSNLKDTDQQIDSYWDSFNEVQPFYSVELAKSFGELWMVEIAKEMIQKVINPQNKKILMDFLTLHMLDTIEKDMKTFRVGDFINTTQQDTIRTSILSLMNSLKSEYIRVIDALAPPDFILQAPFGASDGDIYNRYIEKIFLSKNTFERVAWWKDIQQAHKKNNPQLNHQK